MNKNFIFFFLCSIGIFSKTLSQTSGDNELSQQQIEDLSPGISFSAEVNLIGAASTGEQLPFWMYHNRRGRISEETNISGWITGRAFYKLSENGFLEAGGGLLYQDDFSDEVFIDELYLHFQNSWLQATFGRKQEPELYNGLSASNQNILWSLNARPMPGLQVGTLKPIFFSGNHGIGFEASWEEYLMGKDRIVDNARLHHKSFHLVFRTEKELQFKVGLQHFVQWGGTSPEEGKQPSGFSDYLKLISGQAGDEEAFIGDQMNSLGNHLGSYEFSVSKKWRDYKFELLYNHIFEDGSGRRFGNFPDGRYGIYFGKNKNSGFINAVMYEFYYTHHQSHTTSGSHKYDDYFNQQVYLSGWTYENRIIGAPFFTADPDGNGIINNKFTAHHLGVSGQLGSVSNSLPYKMLLSFSRSDGTYKYPYIPNRDMLAFLWEMKFFEGFADISAQGGAEFNSSTGPEFGLGVHLKMELY